MTLTKLDNILLNAYWSGRSTNTNQVKKEDFMGYSCPKVITKPPGPKARDLIARDHKLLSGSLTRSAPLVGEKAEGMYIEDPDGNVFWILVRV